MASNSIINSITETELQTLTTWLGEQDSDLGLDLQSLAPITGDASFRHYFRINGRHNRLIVMYAPTTQENSSIFIQIANALRDSGIRVPQIIKYDLQQGFLLLSDLGQINFLQAIQNGVLTANDYILQQHYRGALRTLVTMQQCPAGNLPVYDKQRILEELDIFTHWYIQKYKSYNLTDTEKTMLEHTFDLLASSADEQAKVFVHRDFHSPNLMITDNDKDYTPGVIDFQDAVYGPISYDIASLVMDARTSWDEPQQIDWAVRYWEYAKEAKLAVPDDFAIFHTDYEWMSLQRNLRILGVFVRLSLRDNKHWYLDHLPRVMDYIRQVTSRYIVFHPLLRLLDKLENVTKTDGFSF